MSRRDAFLAGGAAERERGAVLVLFALLLVGMFGMLAVLVDGGRLRVTRQQMDAGAEHAALEGVRFKDSEGDVGRRLRARIAMARQFDDDLVPDHLVPANADRIGLGAGTLPVVAPVVASGPAAPFGGSIAASSTPAARYWNPEPDPTSPDPQVRAAGLQDNLANAAHGDLVAGTHDPGAGEPIEDDLFQRNDFVATTFGSSAAQLAAAPAFLVRLRRASDRLAFDRQPGVSSAGPPFEFLWARGSAWREPGPGETHASRADGLTVRAAAIASTERALVVTGLPGSGLAMAPFALRAEPASSWSGTLVGDSLVVTVDSIGTLTLGGQEEGAVLFAAGFAPVVGLTIAPRPGDVPSMSAGQLIVPVYGIVGTIRRIAGFTLATATLVGDELTVIRVPGGVLPVGASAVAPAALDARVELGRDPALRALHLSFPFPVLAPVLRR